MKHGHVCSIVISRTEDKVSNELAPVVKMGSFIKRVGITGTRALAKERMAGVKPEECVNRYAIGFDDSGSMSGQPLADAKKAVAGFLSSCNPVETSVAIYPFNAKAQPLTVMYDVATAYTNGIPLGGGTPLYEVMNRILDEVKPTRAILFSDGEPGDSEGTVIDKAREAHVPFDCVYIGYGDSAVLRGIAERTGGNYLHFDTSTVFAKQLKYLSPKYVALLSNADLKARVERGETI